LEKKISIFFTNMRKKSIKTAILLEYFTVGYNILEAAASLTAGILASSIALTGFGLDSVVESLSGFVLIWRLKKHGAESDGEEKQTERRAVRFVGVTFWILGGYVLFESINKIIEREASEPSVLGIVIAAFSVVIMPVLGWRKYVIGKRLGLKSLVADSKETFACFALSSALLVGLVARSIFNFRLADPLVGLFIVMFLFKEGWELLL
jgi:divalent metal cation (Fe/Co/Zn/Cd) transporter